LMKSETTRPTSMTAQSKMRTSSPQFSLYQTGRMKSLKIINNKNLKHSTSMTNQASKLELKQERLIDSLLSFISTKVKTRDAVIILQKILEIERELTLLEEDPN